MRVTRTGTPDAPLASIIIVAWRLVDELRECLDSLQASLDAPRYEVIVVLNGASEEIAAVATRHPIVSRVVVRHANIGFGAACNLAAAVARGTYLVFLNDDTRVDAYWLRTLTEAAAGHEAVASLLLNYDGTVQEAGSRLLSHGGTLQLGKGMELDEAREAGFAVARPIDYGSAAALLMRKSAFDRLGGFDALFEPAYFEDVDLQLRLRETGAEVWLEPDAKVLHHSGRSTNSDHWFRQFAANRSGHRFIERWPEVLATAPAADDPASALCTVPLRKGSVPNYVPADPRVDDSRAQALTIAHDYEAWLTTQLDQLSEYHAEISTNPNAPTRRELLDQVRTLGDRVKDLEKRGPWGVLKMNIGVWLTGRRDDR